MRIKKLTLRGANAIIFLLSTKQKKVMDKYSKESPQESFQESIKIISYCPLCRTHYNPLSAQILEQRENAHLIYIRCRKCSSSIVALVVTGIVGVSSMGLVTDLTSKDVLKFQHSETIQYDDVIDISEQVHSQEFIHQILKVSYKPDNNNDV